MLPRWLKASAVVLAVAILGAIAFAYFEPVQVLPRVRLAPGYSLIDQQGELYSSETARGSVTLYSFAPGACTTCDDMYATMAEVADRVAENVTLTDIDVRLVTVALDETEPVGLAAAARRSGADGRRWRWIGGSNDEIRTVVGAGFRQYFETTEDGSIKFDPGYILVDGAGVVRGDYRYRTLADDADKLETHLEILADEIRYAKGAAAVAYEAAHLFLCYP